MTTTSKELRSLLIPPLRTAALFSVALNLLLLAPALFMCPSRDLI